MNEEGSAVGWGILSFIIPLVGLILFLVWKNEKPHTAKVCGICALVSFCLSIVIEILFVSLILEFLAYMYALAII